MITGNSTIPLSQPVVISTLETKKEVDSEIGSVTNVSVSV